MDLDRWLPRVMPRVMPKVMQRVMQRVMWIHPWALPRVMSWKRCLPGEQDLDRPGLPRETPTPRVMPKVMPRAMPRVMEVLDHPRVLPRLMSWKRCLQTNSCRFLRTRRRRCCLRREQRVLGREFLRATQAEKQNQLPNKAQSHANLHHCSIQS